MSAWLRIERRRRRYVPPWLQRLRAMESQRRQMAAMQLYVAQMVASAMQASSAAPAQAAAAVEPVKH